MRTQAPPILEPLSFPLHGSRLIEASAGTGKTYTIAALYLRLVLGAGGEHAYPRPLTPPEVLVVTFTEAATQELRDRIRALLAAGAAAFQADPTEVDSQELGQDLLHDLRGTYAPELWPGCARKLQLAAEWMDEAAVSTIHGWCNRMLREHAFDSDSLFTQTLEPDQRELLAEAVRDYWRIFVYPRGAADAASVQGWWPTPQALEAVLSRLLEHTATLGPGVAPDPAIRTAKQQAQRELAALKQPWSAWADELQALLDQAVAAKQVNGTKLQKRYYQPWLDTLRAWAADLEAVLPDLKTGWTRLTPTGLAEAWKTGSPPAHPAQDALAILRDQLQALPDAREDVLRHATRWVAGRCAAEQERRAQMGFNDLLTRLDAALHGPNGDRLAGLIRRQFPVALIDEFQDTDPLQYRIFSTLYLGTAPSADSLALILIGDPKQAIYAFRGADIHTYLAARRDTEGRHYTLGINYRSSKAMVDATNHCFEQAERRPMGQGAFLFRKSEDNPLPFTPVGARGRTERWQVNGRDAAALTCWWLDEGSEAASKGSYLERMAAVSATQIVHLLQSAHTGFVQPDGRLQRVQPGDIAVLVNTGREAAVMRQALGRRGVRSVYLSDQDS
ncbi:MAG TPA: UvrD-helicase domain-containing protein, partial [Burkholderiaceae bacterium]|nr:UvrD-helicase domain-containing protein [Burkholderiaceae bacterium]